MNTRQTLLFTALAAFAGGFVAGLLVAPHSGREARRRLAASAQDSKRWLGERLNEVEEQLGTLEEQVQTAGSQWSEKVRAAANKALDPFSQEDDEAWTLERKEVARDLRRMPRK